MLRVSVGDKFDRLTVVELIPNKKNPKAKCVCVCGNICYPQRGALKNKRATSCGCKKAEDFVNRATSHGMSKTSTYKIWRGMLARCNNKNLPEYENYGGRGIKVLWQSFEDFYKDMGERPKGHWIDRVDNNGHYEKNNCKWVMPEVNQKNKRVSRIWVIDGIAYDSSIEAGKSLGVSSSVIIRGCNGYKRNGKEYAPRDGWHSFLKY